MRALNERGLTLTELAIVGAMGLLVMTAIMGFYMNCQTIWTDASSKSNTQREATGLMEHISEQVHRSARAVVTEEGDITHCRVQLFNQGEVTPWYSFWWADSMIHESGAGGDSSTNVTSVVERFQMVPCLNCDELVELTDLQLRSAEGRRVSLSTKMALYNR